jgi:hypothetical protein
MLPDGDLFFVSAEFQRRLSGIRTAFVNPFEHNREPFDFAVTVGQNRGGQYGLFDNDADGEAWLLQ